MVRDVDKIDLLPDAKIKQHDKDYLEQHKLDKTFHEVLNLLLTAQPPEPVQFVIDCIQYDSTEAAQDPRTGLPKRREDKLKEVFRIIDKDCSGQISFRTLQQYTNRYGKGGKSLTTDELREIFSDFKPQAETFISESEFLVFFSKVSKQITNRDFDNMITELSM